MDIIRVVCGVIFKDEQVFLCRRKAKKSLAGYWEFPGGKIEVDETEEESLHRELQEELGMKVIVGKHFKSVIHAYDTVTIELIAYLCQFQEATYTLSDHDQYEWVDKEHLLDWNLAPADIPIAQALMNN